MSRQTGSQGTSDGRRNPPLQQKQGQGFNQAPAGGHNPGGGRDGGDDRGGQECYNCHRFGHRARDCPERYYDGRGNTGAHNYGFPQERQGGYRGAPSRGGSYRGTSYRSGPSQEGPGGRGGYENLGNLGASREPSAQTVEDEAKEDKLVANFRDVQRTGVPIPYRPNYGSLGEKVEVSTNYFEMKFKPNLVLYHYSIALDETFKENKDRPKEKEKMPEPKGKKLEQIIKLMLASPAFTNWSQIIVTDFRATLISLKVLPEEMRKQEVRYFHEADTVARNDAQIYNLHIQQVSKTPTLKISDLMTFLTSTNPSALYPHRLTMIQALNILIGHHTNASNTTIVIGGKRAFPPLGERPESQDLEAGLCARRGFFSSVRLASCRTLINVNISHGAFYKHKKLIELMLEYSLITPSFVEWEPFFKGLKVRTNYLKDKDGKPITMIRTISGFAHGNDVYEQEPGPKVDETGGSPMQVWFHLKDSADFATLTTRTYGANSPGREQMAMLKKRKGRGKNYISVCEFFGAKHGIWSDLAQRFPVVNLGSRKKPSFVLAEVCTVEPGQLSRSKLSAAQTTSMMKFAKLDPPIVAEKITPNGLRSIGLHPGSPQMAGFGVDVNKTMVKVLGRMLSPPMIEYQGREIGTSGGKWNIKGKVEFMTHRSQPLTNWEYLAICQRRVEQESKMSDDYKLRPSLQVLCEVLESAGVQTSLPKGQTLAIVNSEDTILANAIQQAALKGREVLLIILPGRFTRLYNAIKKLADVQFGIQTICVIAQFGKFYDNDRKLEGSTRQYCANVALKFNMKLGGTNHTLLDPLNKDVKRLGIISEHKTMVVGIDVTHPGPGSASPSIAAMVACIDANLAQWPVDLRVQIRTRQEMVGLLDAMLVSRLRLWKAHHGAYPENILVYRDGVSESQYEQVLETEFKLMREACPRLYDEAEQPHPRFTIIIVGKRHHTRFFPPPGSPAGDGSGKSRNGLVVDRGITEARNWDFFLQSHASALGTARPSHYCVIWDEIFTDPRSGAVKPGVSPADVLEQLTHDMCYLFGRATKAVSLCPPVYYADIACERAGRYLADESYGSESGRSDEEMSAGERERLRLKLQEKIKIHERLKDTMFYI